MKHIHLDKLPNGMNVIVAMARMEVSIEIPSCLISLRLVGIIQSTFCRCYRDEEKKNQLTGEEDIFCRNPDIIQLCFPNLVIMIS